MVEMVNTDYIRKSDYNVSAAGDNNTAVYETSESPSIFMDRTSFNADVLETELESVMAEQGAISNAWNDFKEFTNLGTSNEKCNDAIEKYKNGEITFEEAQSEIEEFAKKQDSSLNLFSNIATSIAAITAVTLAPVTGGASLAVGAAVGAVTKAGFKCADRATNEVEGDALDAKQLAKDALSGAVTGAIAGRTAGTGANTYANGFGGLSGIAACAAKSTRTGLITGAVSGSSNYLIECAFEDDVDFNMNDFVSNTVTNAAVSGAVGAFMGTTTGALRAGHVLNTSDASLLPNCVSTTSYKIANDRIKAAGSLLLE